MEQEEKAIVNSEQWYKTIEEIATMYEDGKIISHEWLKKKFGIERLSLSDYDTADDFIEALQNQQFAYMSLVESLRTQLLSEYNMYLKNDRGIGYTILRPEEQVSYGYNKLQSDIKEAMRKASLIMTNVQPVSREQQAKDNDMRAKASMLKQMLQSIK